jgi:hypothetical protein
MAFKGSHCTKGYKRVRSVYGGTVRRCKGFGRGRRKKRKGYGRGHAPFNKGKKCRPGFKVEVWSPRHGKMVTRCKGKGAFGGKRNGNGKRSTWGFDPQRGFHTNGSQTGPIPLMTSSAMARRPAGYPGSYSRMMG